MLATIGSRAAAALEETGKKVGQISLCGRVILSGVVALHTLDDETRRKMQYRPLGKTGLQVSSLCFGTMSFGAEADDTVSAAMYQRCRDAGINFFDCANVYAKGRSEEILGRLVAGHRDDLVLTSKVGFPTGADMNARGLSRRNIVAVEVSRAAQH